MPATPVRSVQSLGSKMGSAIRTISPRIAVSLSPCSKTRDRRHKPFQSTTMKPHQKYPRG